MELPQNYAIQRAADGVPVVNSREVAGTFDKRHADVLRDIGALNIDADLHRSWFRPITVLDNYNREQPAYDMTRDGFAILVMGWSGEKAMTLKIAYIQAFNEWEAQQKGTAANVVTYDDLIGTVREIVGPLSIRFDGQDRAIERIESRLDNVAEDIADIKFKQGHPRRRITDSTRAEHLWATEQMGGICPCCGRANVVVNGEKSPFAEYDHFYSNSQNSPDHTWLICKPDHSDLTTGRVPRDRREAEFRAYQEKRRRLPGRQPKLQLF